MNKRKPWINKKKSIIYELVSRPERDNCAGNIKETPSALHPVKAFGKVIDDDVFIDLLANKINPNYEEDINSDYWIEDEAFETRLTKPIGKPGGVFLTPDGEVLNSQQAWDPDYVELPTSDEFVTQNKHEILDPEIEEVLENFEEGKIEALNDDFIKDANDGELPQLEDVDQFLDIGGEYGLDQLEGDIHVNDTYLPKNSIQNNNNNSNNNNKKLISQLKNENEVTPLSDIMKNLVIGKTISNFDYEEEEEEEEEGDEFYEDNEDDYSEEGEGINNKKNKSLNNFFKKFKNG